MRVLVVGGGGREHALVRALRASGAREVACAPGNAGIAAEAECLELPAGPEALAELAAARGTDLTVVGPEAPLCSGVADAFAARGLALFGPTRAAAELEGSKVFAKRFMARHGIPTAPFQVFDDPDAALDHVVAQADDLVVKADGLCAGKGVFVCRGAAEAQAAIRDLLVDGAFGEAGRRVVVERRLRGREASLLVLTDGERALPLPAAQDYKRALDGDHGPNTGGMGAVSPAPAITSALVETCLARIVHPTLRGLRAEGRRYRGVLYVGLMIQDGEPYVLEYNCRFGDPEAQAVLARMGEPLLPLLGACAGGSLPGRELVVRPETAVVVVIASGGYPGRYRTGLPIEGLSDAARIEGVSLLHAGTRREGGRVVTASGRVLDVVATGPDAAAARARAYRAVDLIRFDGVHARRDIAPG